MGFLHVGRLVNTLAIPSAGPDTEPRYATLGRALSLASSFEIDCRMLALTLKLRDPSLDGASAEQFGKAVSDPVVEQLGNNHGRIAKELGLSESAKDWLTIAREARNYIAHQAGEEFGKSVPERERWAADLKAKAREVAVGKVAIAILLSRVSSVPKPTGEAIDSFLASAPEWVLHGTCPLVPP